MPEKNPTFELVIAGTGEPRQFTAWVSDDTGASIAEHSFEWRVDSTALALDLGALARAARSLQPPDEQLHISFGQQLYQTIFAGAVGELWQQRRQQAGCQPLRLVLRIDPQSARPFLNLPWEYLHDGQDFLSLNLRTPISRFPWGIQAEVLPALKEPLRLLVMIAAPLGLSENEVLNTAREEDIILAATAQARKSGMLQIEFTPNGSLESLETALREYDPHILHFTGHGAFVEALDQGIFLMEDIQGQKREVPSQAFVERIERGSRSLRLAFLSACQSAVAARTEGFTDLAPRLLGIGISAVVAMQYSVIDSSAIALAGAFYQGLSAGDPLDEALTEARRELSKSGVGTADFATPVLFMADPRCMQVNRSDLEPVRDGAPLDLSGLTYVQNFVGRNAELRQLQTNLDPERGVWRAAVIYGLGGMGKTVLAARLAQRMVTRLDGVKTLRMTPTTTAQSVLDQLGAFLLVNNARFNHSQIPQFNRIKDDQLPLESKVGLLAEILGDLKLLLVFDNCEDILSGGQAVSRAASLPETGISGVDPDLLKLVSLLVGSVSGPSRFLFTSRVDFDPVERGRLTGAIGHLDLGEMGYREAVYLMETLPPLDDLDVALVQEILPDESLALMVLTKRDLYEHLGGHPYTLKLFSEHARRTSVGEVLKDLSIVQKEVLEFTLLDRAVGQLPDNAAELLRRAAIYDEAVPVEGLAYLVGDESEAMPDVGSEVQALLNWGLMARPPGQDNYVVHSLVREWGRGKLKGEERLELLRRAARFWLGVGRDSSNLVPLLIARHYLFQAEDYEQADEIVQLAWSYLRRYGLIELLIGMLKESVNSLQGRRRAVALGNLATVYQGLGIYDTARQYNEAVLAEFENLGERRNVATSLHNLGNLHYLQGEYTQARQRYKQALAIAEELDDQDSVASSLVQLGMLCLTQGEYTKARQYYEQSLAIFTEMDDRTGVANSLHNLGNLHYLQNEYSQSRQRYEQSLTIFQDLGDRAGVSRNLHQLGILHQNQMEYSQARKRFEQSLEIFQELGDRAGVASSQHQLGMLHQAQGEYSHALHRFEQALAIFQELGDQSGLANCLGQLGMLHQDQGNYSKSRHCYEEALAVAEKLGDRAVVANSLHNLGNLHFLQGEYHRARQCYKQALASFQDLGDRDGVALCLGQLGRLYEEEGDDVQAVRLSFQAFKILDQLGSPNRDIAGRSLARLLKKMGEDAFMAVLQNMNANEPPIE